MSKIRVSDHAIVRYLERHYEFDVDFIREEIFPQRIKNLVESGAVRYTLNGIDFVIVNNTVVTGHKKSSKNNAAGKGHLSNKSKGQRAKQRRKDKDKAR